MERYNELIDKLTFDFSFIDCLNFKYRLENLKNEFCITNILYHLLFCSRSRVSSSCCRLCMHLFVTYADDFVSSVKYHFSHILVNKFNNKEIEDLHKREKHHLSLTCCIRLKHILTLLILTIIVVRIF